MPDITMCKQEDCGLKEKCYRYKARPWEYQSYFAEDPRKDGKCEYYCPIKKDKIMLDKE